MQLPGRLIAQQNKVQISRDSVGDRRAGGCAASAWRSGSAIIPEGGLPNAMALIVRRCQPSGPSKSPKNYRTATVYRLPWSRNPSSSSEIEEYRKVLLQFTAEQPLSAERGRSLGWSSPDQPSFFRVAVSHIVLLGHRQTSIVT
ncbi:hypothetical protein GEV33_003848 [Tenebrio molitor]|uniref:Uncharacterized protein n=1 Tax=Tenebrio molitor TaxID=7067 RepID=A0A8J6HSS4_TENMO|nr:hypothetical protein GEV33_003848 [Tenebrio molitor]